MVPAMRRWYALDGRTRPSVSPVNSESLFLRSSTGV